MSDVTEPDAMTRLLRAHDALIKAKIAEAADPGRDTLAEEREYAAALREWAAAWSAGRVGVP